MRGLGVGAPPAALAALVAVLLLVRPVELEELGSGLGEMPGAGRELIGQIPAQPAALLLHPLRRAQRLVRQHRAWPVVSSMCLMAILDGVAETQRARFPVGSGPDRFARVVTT